MQMVRTNICLRHRRRPTGTRSSPTLGSNKVATITLGSHHQEVDSKAAARVEIFRVAAAPVEEVDFNRACRVDSKTTWP